MQQEVKLTPMQLYFLGTRMGAKYIDYQYIAAMPDIQKKYTFHEQETLEELEEMELLMEDFSGNVEIEEGVRALLEPVFFGTTESRLDTGRSLNIHLYDGRMTLASLENDLITFRGGCEADLRRLLAEAAGDVTVQCSKAGIGFTEKTFTGGELKNRETMDQAVKMLKGEC